MSFIGYPLFKLSIWFQGPATWEEFIGGDGFTGWLRYSRYTDNIDVGGIMQILGNVNDVEREGYEAPYPNATYKAGAQIFPYLIPSEESFYSITRIMCKHFIMAKSLCLSHLYVWTISLDCPFK